jgi:hypothetical protein
MPVIKAATTPAPAASAADRKSTSTAGLQWCTGGVRSSLVRKPSPRRSTAR